MTANDKGKIPYGHLFGRTGGAFCVVPSNNDIYFYETIRKSVSDRLVSVYMFYIELFHPIIILSDNRTYSIH